MLHRYFTAFIIFTLITPTLSIFVGGLPVYAQEAETCVIQSAKFVNYHGIQYDSFFKHSGASRPDIVIDVQTSGCVGDKIKIRPADDITSPGTSQETLITVNNIEALFTVPTNGFVRAFVKAGEITCDSGSIDAETGIGLDCDTHLRIYKEGIPTLLYSSLGKPQGALKYNCDGICDRLWTLSNSQANAKPLETCFLMPAVFNPAGGQSAGFYNDTNPPTVTITIPTVNCAGKMVEVSLTEEDIGSSSLAEGNIDTNESILNNRSLLVPSDGNLIIELKAGDKQCDAFTITNPPSGVYNCNYHVETTSDLGLISTTSKNRLAYNCDSNGCGNKEWEVSSSTGNEQCTVEAIDSAKFVNHHGTKSDEWYSELFGHLVHMEIVAPDCAGQKLWVSLVQNRMTGPNINVGAINNKELTVPENGILNIYAWAGEDKCQQSVGSDCTLFLEVKATNNALYNSTFSTKYKEKGTLNFDCDGVCDTNWILTTGANEDGARCRPVDATMTPHGVQSDTYYKKDLRPQVDITIQTEDCVNHVLKTSVMYKETTAGSVQIIAVGAAAGAGAGTFLGPAGWIGGALIGGITASFFAGDAAAHSINKHDIRVDSSGVITIKAKAGIDHCPKVSTSPGYEHCVYYLQFENPLGIKFNFFGEKDSIRYKCEGTPDSSGNINCAITALNLEDKWNIVYHNGVKADGEPVYFTPPSDALVLKEGDPCVGKDSNDELFMKPGCYGLLAPLGETTEINLNDKDNPFSLGDYVNLIVGIVIAIASLLAVVMLVVGGVQYMTTDAFSGKSEARETITKALLGLILALGSYLILKTINPNLLSVEPNIEKLSYTADMAGWAETETAFDPSDQVTQAYKLKGTFTSPIPSNSAVKTFVTGLSANNDAVSEIIVKTAGPGSNNNGTATFKGTNGSEVTIDVRFGTKGVAAKADQVEGDNKTPLGEYTLNIDRRPKPDGIPVEGVAATTNSAPSVNLGAAYYQISIVLNGKNRGIGFHGRSDNSLKPTNGCIRMTNDDLILLGPFMKSGVTVKII